MANKPLQLNLSLNAILVPDSEKGGFTAFLKQFPEVLAEGETENEALTNLLNTLHTYLEYKGMEEDGPEMSGTTVIERSVNIKLSTNLQPA